MSMPALTLMNPAGCVTRSETAASLTIEAGAHTDYFSSPDGALPVATAPLLVFSSADSPVSVAVRVAPSFREKFDAGGLMVFGSGGWGKLAFERSPQGLSTVVTVVTRDTSDDCNGETFPGRDALWLRLYRQGPVLAFHYSTDGEQWSLARLFSLGDGAGPFTYGLLAQSPVGDGCRVTFDGLSVRNDAIADLRSGE